MAMAILALALLSVVMVTSAAPLGCLPETYFRGTGRKPAICPAAKPSLESPLCFKKCAANYTGYGAWCTKNCPSTFTSRPFVCIKTRDSQACPSGYNDHGPGCNKPTTYRGYGELATCPTNKNTDAGLCYWKCKTNFTGLSRTCWKNVCPAAYPRRCGSLCAKTADTCNEMRDYLSPIAVHTLSEASRRYNCAASNPATYAAAVNCFATVIADIAWGPYTVDDFKTYLRTNLVYCKGL